MKTVSSYLAAQSRSCDPNKLRIAWPVAVLIATLVAIGTMGCHSNRSGTSDTVTRVIGVDGGTIEVSDGLLSLEIPPGALAENTEITLMRVDRAEAQVGFATPIILAFDLQPEGLAFSQPASLTLTLPAPAPEPDSGEVSVPVVLPLYSSDQGVSLLEGATVDLDLEASTLRFTGTIEHFSRFVISEISFDSPELQQTLDEQLESVASTFGDLLGVLLSRGVFLRLLNDAPAQLNFSEAFILNFTLQFVPPELLFQGATERGSFSEGMDVPPFDAAISFIGLTQNGADPFGALEYEDSNLETPVGSLSGLTATQSLLFSTARYQCKREGEDRWQGVFHFTDENLVSNTLIPGSFQLDQNGNLSDLQVNIRGKATTCMVTIADDDDDSDDRDVARLPVGIFPTLDGQTAPEGMARLRRGFGGTSPDGVPILMSGNGGTVVLDLTNAMVLGGLANNVTDFGAIGWTSQYDSVLTYASNGASLSLLMNGLSDFALAQSLQPGANITDAQPIGDDPDNASGFVLTDNSNNSISLNLWDTSSLSYREENFVPSFRLSAAVSGRVVSAVASDGADSVLIATDGTPGHLLYDMFDAGDLLNIGSLGDLPRRLRCQSNICAVSNFGDQSLTIIRWGGAGVMPVIVGEVPTGNGPIGIDLYKRASGHVAIASTGFFDNTYTITEVDPMGTLVSNTTMGVPTECVNPGHVIWLPDGPTLKVAITCNGSDKYALLDTLLSTDP